MVDLVTFIRIAISSMLFFAIAAAPASAASVKVDAVKCEKQLEQFARTDIDCAVSARVDDATLGDVPDGVRGLVVDLVCTLPISAPKADVYGKWIRTDTVSLPRTKLSCSKRGGDLKFDLVFDIQCTKSQGDWRCPEPVAGVDRIGVMGTAFANYLNRDGVLPQALERLLREHDG